MEDGAAHPALMMRERMSPRTLLRRMRMQLPDTIEALKQVPQIFQAAVREAAAGSLAFRVENTDLRRLRDELRRVNGRRDSIIAAGVLWLSGLIWLAVFDRLPWFGWLQMAAALVLVVRHRMSSRPSVGRD